MTTPARARALAEVLARVTAAWPKAPWGWDDRFDCALATVKKDLHQAAHAALAAGLPSIWTPATLANAPAAITQLCTSTGGLKPGQLAFSAELPDGGAAYCLWWPWGGGANVSARLGALGGEELASVIRAALGIDAA